MGDCEPEEKARRYWPKTPSTMSGDKRGTRLPAYCGRNHKLPVPGGSCPQCRTQNTATLSSAANPPTPPAALDVAGYNGRELVFVTDSEPTP